MESESKKTVRQNVLTLLGRVRALRANESGVTRLKDLGIPHGNAQRTVDKESDIQLSTLDQVAGALKVKPWQLLIEGLDADKLPALVAPVAAPTDDASREATDLAVARVAHLAGQLKTVTELNLLIAALHRAIEREEVAEKQAAAAAQPPQKPKPARGRIPQAHTRAE